MPIGRVDLESDGSWRYTFADSTYGFRIYGRDEQDLIRNMEKTLLPEGYRIILEGYRASPEKETIDVSIIGWDDF